MKPVIIIAIAFVLLVPTSVLAQEGSRNMMEEYCLKNLQDDPQCENYTPKKMEQNKIESPKASNPFEKFIQFILEIFQDINPEETVKDVTKEFSLDSVQNTVENTIEDISDSIPIDMDTVSGNSETKLEDCSKYKNEVKYSTDVDKVFTAVQKTKACEQRNKQIEMQQPTQGIVTSEPVNNVFLHGMMVPPWTGPDGVIHDKAPIVGTFSIGTIIVSDKEYYKIVSLKINLRPENLQLDDMVYVSPVSVTLKNEKGKVYLNQLRECNSPASYLITGKKGPNMSMAVCYEVEKEFDRFDVFFRSENQKNYEIGSFTLQ